MRRMYSENQIAELIKKNPQAVIKALQGQDISVEGITSKGIANTGNIANIGDIATTGKITGNSIIQDNSGYSSSGTPASSVEIDYKGVVQNGNKVTFVVSGKIVVGATAIGTYTAISLGGFDIPSEVGTKIIPIYNDYVDFQIITLPLNDLSSQVNVNGYVQKNSNSQIAMKLNTMASSLSANKTYLFRHEVTFLLSESLESE